MFLNKLFDKARGVLTKPLSLKKSLLYLSIVLVPLLIYPIEIDGSVINIRQIREIGFVSISVVFLTFLQNYKWLRYFIIWCVLGWWCNFFIPSDSYGTLVNISCALILFVSLRKLIENNTLSIDIILKLICLSVLFQFVWLLMQRTGYDPVFYAITAVGKPLLTDYKPAPVPLTSWSGNPAVLGLFFAICSPLLLHYFKIKKIPILFILILISVFLLKNALMIICFGIVIIFYVLNIFKEKFKRNILLLLVLIGSISYFYIVKQPNIDRLDIWKKLLELSYNLRPIIGKGLGSFSDLSFYDTKTHTHWDKAHNDYLQLIFETGIVGFVLFAGFVASVIVKFYRQIHTHRELCMMCCLVAFLVSGVAFFPMHLAQLSFYAIVIWACLEGSYSDTKCFVPKSS